MKLNDIFNFGKFKGFSLKKVMAEHGSYVGWCLENIPNFHIQPEELEDTFLINYNIWKEKHKGMTVKYTPNDKSYLKKIVLGKKTNKRSKYLTKNIIREKIK